MKLFLLCIDGASWNVMDGLLNDSQLPHLARLISEGSKGTLDNFGVEKSPIIWTSIATGKRPEQHGIQDFVARQLRLWKFAWLNPALLSSMPYRIINYLEKLGVVRRVSVQSSMRKCKAIWNILTDAGKTANVVNWWATHPAEKINGYMVSDHANYFRMKLRKDDDSINSIFWVGKSGFFRRKKGDMSDSAMLKMKNAVHPSKFAERVCSLSADIKESELLKRIAKFIEITPSDREKLRDIPSFHRSDPLSVLKFSIYQDEFAKRSLLLSLSESKEQPDFLSVYLGGLDAISHHFWKYMFPHDFSPIDSEEMDKFQHILSQYYVYMDEILGHFRDELERDTAIIVISDHGFESVEVEGAEGANSGSHASAPDGIFIIGGNSAIKRADVNTKMVDITPTALYLLGLPVGEDMAGAVLTEAIQEDYLHQHPVAVVDTWENDVDVLKNDVESRGDTETSEVEEEVKDRLRALGYID